MRRPTTIAIGGFAIRFHASDKAFLELLEDRYAGFVESRQAPDCVFEVDLTPPADRVVDEDVRVFREGALWRIERGDFRGEWDPAARRGRIRQSANPYSLDTLLRIVHTLLLAREGGFLLHASSAIRNGRAFVFAGASGAGKTTISSLAPKDANVLTDEISYVRKEHAGYRVYGTPFAGELGRPGENLSGPLEGVFVLAQGRENRMDDVAPADALRGVLANMLFFAEDPDLVRTVFQAAADLVECVPVRRLTFVPDARVWDLIRR